MSAYLKIVILFVLAFTLQSLITRHDVPDDKFVQLAKLYPQICHLPMGEATLIDSSWALTAGHVGNDLARDIKDGYSPTLTYNGIKYQIDKVVIHPAFKSLEEGIQHDIALIKIKGSVKNGTPAKLYDKQDETGQQITIVGMGDMGTGLTGPQKWDKITRAATNKIDEVDNQWLRFSFDSNESANTTEMEGISGPGDSGGPAFVDKDGVRHIIGISSHQKGQAEYGKGRYGVTEYYVRVSVYSSWIKETIVAEKNR